MERDSGFNLSAVLRMQKWRNNNKFRNERNETGNNNRKKKTRV